MVHNKFKQGSSIVLARVLGNDLFPRHQDGQTLHNLEFILKYEANFSNVKKLFVINRIFDDKKRVTLENMVKDYGHETLTIPFVGSEYADIPLDVEKFGGMDFFNRNFFRRYADFTLQNSRILACAPKIRYAMNINGARNSALGYGRRFGGWTLPLDGSCFISEEAFRMIEKDFTSMPYAPYCIIPMQRLQNFDEVFLSLDRSKAVEEPQIAIHSSAKEKFDERFPYGIRDKTSLFEAVGVPGPWDNWGKSKWLPIITKTSEDWKQFKIASAQVYRLPSDTKGAVLEKSDNQKLRFQSRNVAILVTIAMLNKVYGAKDIETTQAIVGEQVLNIANSISARKL